jgi:uncharacterized protein YgiM (DUF1202 family)
MALMSVVVTVEVEVIKPNCSPGSWSSTGRGKIYYCHSFGEQLVNLRSEASRDSAVIGKVGAGEQFEVAGEKVNEVGERWIQISDGVQAGWILGDLTEYVVGAPEPTAVLLTPTVAPITVRVPNRDMVYLYVFPSFNSEVIYKITQTEGVEILVETELWAKVFLIESNMEGWVSQDFIEKT